ncbi:MAG: glycosyl hydrolase [Verrucomicrobiota bacterium]
MSYRLLILPPSDRAMRPALLRKLAQFVADGLRLIGAPPEASPSLEHYPECEAEVRLAAQIRGNCDGRSITEHRLGQGKAVWGRSLGDVTRTHTRWRVGRL